jgi:nucleoside-diphosphate-sugar epimerase
MRIVVFGATGNVGSALMRALQSGRSEELVGVARRLPGSSLLAESHPRATWHTADIGVDALDVVAGADVVVSLAWQIQPSHDEEAMRRTNVVGNRRVAEAVVRHRVPKLVYASSVGAYSPGPKQPLIDESWPVEGIATSFYSRHKAEVEAMLDAVERDHPWLDVVRMRTSLVFQRSAASEVHRLFMGRLLPWHLPRPLRVVPKTERLVFQATHATDIADAYVRAIERDVRGAFNIAAEPPLTPDLIARSVGGRAAPIPPSLLRAAAQASWVLRLQPSEAGWLDMALETPLMDTTRARTELGWRSTMSSVDALVELLDGIGDGAGDDTQPLAPRRSA